MDWSTFEKCLRACAAGVIVRFEEAFGRDAVRVEIAKIDTDLEHAGAVLLNDKYRVAVGFGIVNDAPTFVFQLGETGTKLIFPIEDEEMSDERLFLLAQLFAGLMSVESTMFVVGQPHVDEGAMQDLQRLHLHALEILGRIPKGLAEAMCKIAHKPIEATQRLSTRNVATVDWSARSARG